MALTVSFDTTGPLSQPLQLIAFKSELIFQVERT
jgi:hypothetical protein